jgi:hypothetical protein
MSKPVFMATARTPEVPTSMPTTSAVIAASSGCGD